MAQSPKADDDMGAPAVAGDESEGAPRGAISAEKSERILDSAAELFCQIGFRKTSISDIARSAGVGKGTVYQLCDTKEDLLFRVVEREVSHWVEIVSQQTRQASSDPEEQLRASVALNVLLIRDRPLVRALMSGELHDWAPQIVPRLAELRLRGQENLIQILERGQSIGVFRTDLDVPEVASLLQQLLVGGLVMAQVEKLAPEKTLSAGALGLELLLKGLCKR